MSNRLYDKGRNGFAKGDIHWKNGGDTFKCFMIDRSLYDPSDFAVDEFAADIPTNARIGSGGGHADGDAVALTPVDPVAGVCDSGDITFTAVPAGNPLGALVIFKSTGNLATSPLIIWIDTASNMPITPVGVDIPVIWNNGANKVFKL